MTDAGVLRAEDLRRELPATATYLGVDVTDDVVLANLTAVAIAQLAWRNGPVELWHRSLRISDTEMMRANAATTRVVREHLTDDCLTGFADVLPAIWESLADPDRLLPDGRTVREVAAGVADLQVYADQVRAFFDRCGKLIERLGSSEVAGALACYAAAAVWRWWLAPGWPSIVEKIMNDLEGHPGNRGRMVRCPTPPSGLNLMRLRQRLLAGPDLLSAPEARYCRLASLNAPLPQDHDLSPRSRRLLPPAHRSLIICLERPVESFRQRLDRDARVLLRDPAAERTSTSSDDDAEAARQ